MTAGTLFDVLTVTGTVSLAGNLVVMLPNGFKPEDGNSFTIMQYGSRVGDFTADIAPAGYALNRIGSSGTYTITFFSTAGAAATAAAAGAPPLPPAVVQEVIEVTTGSLVTETANLAMLAGPGAPGGSDTGQAGAFGADPFFSSGESSTTTGFVGTSGSISGEGEQKQTQQGAAPAKPKKPPICK
jgi:hypothetical protein